MGKGKCLPEDDVAGHEHVGYEVEAGYEDFGYIEYKEWLKVKEHVPGC